MCARLRETLYVPTSAFDCACVLARRHLFFDQASGSAVDDDDDDTTVILETDDLDDLIVSSLGTSVTVQVLVETNLQSELFFRDFFFTCLHFSQFANKLSLLPKELKLDPLPFLDLDEDTDDLELDWLLATLDSDPDNELSTDVFELLFLLCFTVLPFEEADFCAEQNAEGSATGNEVELSDTNDVTDL